MSDISLHFTPLDLAILFATIFIVPIAIVTAIFAVWYVRSRTRISLVLLVIAAIPCAIGGITRISLVISDWQSERAGRVYQAEHTRTLTKTERVFGFVLPAGTTLERDDATSSEAIVTTHVPISLGSIPIVGEATIGSDGIHGEATLARDAEIDGVTCKAGIAHFDSGALGDCSAARAQIVRGIPCEHFIYLERSDRTAHGIACTIAAAFRTRGVRISAGSEYLFGAVTTKGPQTTSVRVRGRSLTSGQRVMFEETEIKLDVAMTVGTCNVDLVSVGAVGAHGFGYDIAHQKQCSVPLPAGTVRL